MSDPVAQAMGEVLVVGTVSRIGNHFARGRVHRAAFHARPGAARAAVWARCTISKTCFIFSSGLPEQEHAA